jgi:MFS family permease
VLRVAVIAQKKPYSTVLRGAKAQTGQPSAVLHLAACVQVPGGWAAQRWGGRNTLMLSFALWSTASILTPITSISSAPIAVARMAVGVSQGLLIPSIHTVLAQVSKHPAFCLLQRRLQPFAFPAVWCQSRRW